MQILYGLLPPPVSCGQSASIKHARLHAGRGVIGPGLGIHPEPCGVMSSIIGHVEGHPINILPHYECPSGVSPNRIETCVAPSPLLGHSRPTHCCSKLNQLSPHTMIARPGQHQFPVFPDGSSIEFSLGLRRVAESLGSAHHHHHLTERGWVGYRSQKIGDLVRRYAVAREADPAVIQQQHGFSLLDGNQGGPRAPGATFVGSPGASGAEAARLEGADQVKGD